MTSPQPDHEADLRAQVATATWVCQVSDAGIIRVCGMPAYERGSGYLDAERVESLSTGDHGRLVLGAVAGGRAHPYSVMVTTTGSLVDAEPDWRGRCSCPVQANCKHVVAVMLAVRQLLGGPDLERDRWDRVLDGVLENDADAPTAAKPRARAEAPPRIGIAVALVADPDHPGRRDIRVRPTRITRTGGWHRHSSWSDVVDRAHARTIWGNDRQREVLIAVHRLRRTSRWYSAEPALRLSQVSPLVWEVLAGAHLSGVELLADPEPSAGMRPISGVRLDDPTDVVVRVESASDGSATVGAGLTGHPGPVWLIGDPATGTAHLDDEQTLVLTPLRTPPAPVLHELLARPEPLRVPPEDLPVFESVYLPALAATGGLERDGVLVDAVQQPPVRLALTVSAQGATDLRVTARFRYGAAELPVDLAQVAPGRRRRDERAVVERAGGLLTDLRLTETIGGLGRWPRTETHLTGAAVLAVVRRLDELAEHPDLIVEVHDLPHLEELLADPQIIVSGSPDAGTDWFDLHIEVTVDGEKVPFEPLFAALVRGNDVLLLDSGSWFKLDHPALQRLRELIEESRELAPPQAGQARLNRHQLGLFQEVADLGVADEQAESWAAAVARLAGRTLDSATDDLPVPASLHATLRPYQHAGFVWLSTLWDVGLGGLLADDMGLGKTVQVLAVLERARAAGELDDAPVLIVAPTSVVSAWVEQAAAFAPELVIATVTGTSRTRRRPLAEQVAGAHVVITTYTVARLDERDFTTHTWAGLVLDEAQAVKNHRARTHHAIRRIPAPFRLVVTGTPLENSLMDLWSLLAIAAPGLFPDPDAFTEQYRKPIEMGTRPEMLEQLRRRVRPLLLRRTKEDVAPDLPAKQIQIMHLPLTAPHARLYEQHLQRERKRVLGLLEDPDGNRVAILAALTRLRQLALDPTLVEPDLAVSTSTPAKAAALVEKVREVTAEGHRALVFSQFTRYLGILRSTLSAAGIDSAYLDGSMSATARAQEVQRFRAGDVPTFLISLKAGGTGLTLTEADYVFVMDPWWNPAVEAQAIDRAHRIGQSNPVMVYRLVSETTVEDKVVALAERKRALFDDVIGDASAQGALSAQDVRDLLDL